MISNTTRQEPPVDIWANGDDQAWAWLDDVFGDMAIDRAQRVFLEVDNMRARATVDTSVYVEGSVVPFVNAEGYQLSVDFDDMMAPLGASIEEIETAKTKAVAVYLRRFFHLFSTCPDRGRA